MTISISELESLRARMTPGEYRQGAVEKHNVFCPCEEALAPELGRVLLSMNTHFPYADDAAGIVAEHNAMPALLALAKAVMALEPAEAERAIARREWTVAENGGSADADRLLRKAVSADRKYNECRAAILSALQAVRP